MRFSPGQPGSVATVRAWRGIEPARGSRSAVGAMLYEQNDEWVVQRARYMTLETIAPRDDLSLMLPAARPATEIPAAQLLHHVQGHDPAGGLTRRL